MMGFTYLSSNDKNNSFTILVSMHPIDRCVYLDSLVRSILANNNCNICYSDSPTDAAQLNMKDIDLVILGVTEKYIIWNNSGFVSEALKAIEAKVPLLPIMLESGIINLFNTRCGKFHYLENFQKEISENTLLQINNHVKSLSAIIPAADNEARPKIFISYRKKIYSH